MAAQRPVDGVFFDCLMLDGHDLRRLPLTTRKDCLRLLVPPLGPVRYVDHVVGQGRPSSRRPPSSASRASWPSGRASAYTGGRSRDWIKIKCQRRQEFVIGGYTDPQGSRGHFGALHLGSTTAAGPRLVYVSKVGTGFDQPRLKSLLEKLQPLARATPPFDAGAIPKGRGHHWVEPRLVCEVRFSDWTEDGGIRHPTFIGLRSDKKPPSAGGKSRRRGAGRAASAEGRAAPAPAPSPAPRSTRAGAKPPSRGSS